MTVTTSYGFGFVESLDEGNIAANADATSLANGGVAVSGDHGGHTDAQIFDADGTITGGSLLLTGVESAISQLSNGNLVILGDGGTDMFFSIVDGTTGATVLAPTSIGESGPDVLDPEVAGLTGGGFVVAIQDFFGGTDNDVDLRIYNNAGTLITNFAVDASGANDQNPSVAGLADGGFAVAWHRNIGSTNDLYYAVYNADGTVRKAPALFDGFGDFNRNASVVALPGGGFSIVYEDTGWNGATGGDFDLSFATFDAAGNNLVLTDLSQDADNDTVPSATVLSNGMVVVGSLEDAFGHNDPVWTLVDPATGAVLARSSDGTTHNDFSPTVAGMELGQVATFHTNATAGDVVGQVLQAQRFSNGDAANDSIVGDDLQDFAAGGAGADTIRGGLNDDSLSGDAGNDTFELGAGEVGADSIDGGADSDRILALATVSLVNASLTSIEEIEFNFPNPTATDVTIEASQVGAGLASNLIVDGNANSVADTLRILMRTDTNVNLSAFTFVTFDTGGTENDRIVVLGDADGEIIVGSSVRDEIFGDDGNDRLTGGGGTDVLRGGDGDDIYGVNAAGEAIEVVGQGTDLVRSNATYVLGANIENLTLVGVANRDGTGNNLDNRIVGNTGTNTLNGLGGDDTLTGGLGALDRFDFTTALNAATNVDRILDFEAGVDKIRLDDAIFTELSAGPALTTAEFRIGTAATDASDRIIYNSATGALLYDEDGVGGVGQILFARVDPGLALTAGGGGDFLII